VAHTIHSEWQAPGLVAGEIHRAREMDRLCDNDRRINACRMPTIARWGGTASNDDPATPTTVCDEVPIRIPDDQTGDLELAVILKDCQSPNGATISITDGTTTVTRTLGNTVASASERITYSWTPGSPIADGTVLRVAVTLKSTAALTTGYIYAMSIEAREKAAADYP